MTATFKPIASGTSNYYLHHSEMEVTDGLLTVRSINCAASGVRFTLQTETVAIDARFSEAEARTLAAELLKAAEAIAAASVPEVGA